MSVSNIQFKRILKYSGTSKSAIEYIRNSLNPALKNGEPLLVSYKDSEEEDYKFFIALGVDEESRKIKITPTFNSIDDFAEYIKYYSSGLTSENLADSSDITITKDKSGHYIIKLKANIISSDSLSTTITSGEEEITLTQSEFNNIVWNRVTTIEDSLIWHKL